MPPKAQAKAKVAQVVQDKTFGMKNKNKSKKVQEYITNVEKMAQSAGKNKDLFEDERKKFEAKKAADKKAKEDEWLLGGGTAVKKLQRDANKAEAERKRKEAEAAALKEAEKPEEIDPKTILCEQFMKGLCMAGDACKFSHDDAKARKSAKLSLYQDPREKLLPGFIFRTEKICQKFLDAVENSKYGYFWVCPNGGDKCIFRHCLPFGYVIKRDIKVEGGELEDVDLAEQIEIERSRLDISKCTPVTEERLKDWMITRKKIRDQEIEIERQQAAKKSGAKGIQVLSGRSLFQFDPSIFKDDEDAADETELVIVKSVEEQDAGDLGDSGFANLADEVPEEEEEQQEEQQLEEENVTLEDGTEVNASLFE